MHNHKNISTNVTSEVCISQIAIYPKPTKTVKGAHVVVGGTSKREKNRIGKIFQVPLKSLSNSNFGDLAATTGTPMGAEIPVLSPNDHPNSSQGCQKGFRKKLNLGKFSGATKHQQFCGFGGVHGSGYMGLTATMWAPWVLKYP